MSIRAIPDRSFGVIWGLDIDLAGKLNALLVSADRIPWRNRFYGIHVRGVAIGIWLSTREKKGDR